MYLLGSQAKANSTNEVQVRIFRNDSFSLEHAGFPMLAEISKNIYVEVKGEELSIDKNRPRFS